jgi:ferric iron reductase protein FhuF
VRDALRAAASLGSFFALATELAGGEPGPADGTLAEAGAEPRPADGEPAEAGADGDSPALAGWLPPAGLYWSGLDGLRSQASGRLAAAEPRVTASIIQLGYAARLWSPVLGAALLGSVVPDLATVRIRQDGPGRPVALALPEPRGWVAADPAEVAALAYHAVVKTHLDPLARGLRGQLATGLLWGNAASAMAGALGVLVAARPELRDQATAVAGALLSTGLLRNTGQLGVRAGGLGFRRRSCCLYYRLPGGGLCGDCSLSQPPGT